MWPWHTGSNCFNLFQFSFSDWLSVNTTDTGCKKVRNIKVNNLKLCIARSTIHILLSKIKNHYWKTSKLRKSIMQWFETDVSHPSHSGMNSYKNYYTSNLLFIFQIIWFLTFAWFLFQACDVRGSANATTKLDSRLKNETCKCKSFVKGEFCNECKEGYWNLTQINPDGCQSK